MWDIDVVRQIYVALFQAFAGGRRLRQADHDDFPLLGQQKVVMIEISPQ
jgi:hypothetical protein